MHLCVIFDLSYHLPDGVLMQLGPASVGTAPPFPAIPTPTVRLRSEAHHWVMNYPQRIDFNTSTYYWVYTKGQDPIDAVQHVYANIDPAVTFALSYLAGTEVQSRHLCTYDAITRQNVSTRYSPLYREVSIQPPNQDYAGQMVAAVLADRTLLRATHYLAQARQLWLAAATTESVSDTLRDMSVLHFAKTIEALAVDERVLLAHESDTRNASEKERVVLNLRKTLNGSREIRRKIGAIESAHQTLSRMDNRYLDLKITLLSESLNLGNKWLKRAKELTRVRNRNIAHAGALLSPAERNSLFQEDAQGGPKVESLAETALAAFLLRHAARGWADAVPARGSASIEVPGAPVHLDWS